jgi:hypothetical protein
MIVYKQYSHPSIQRDPVLQCSKLGGLTQDLKETMS